MFKKAAAFILGAFIMTGASVTAFAQEAPQTVVVQREYGASAAKTWDGKSEMKAGKSYVLKKNVTITGTVTIPKGATLTLNSGVKLGIGAKGTLNVKGKLAIKSGATLSVTGNLVIYKGGTVSDSGSIKLTKNKANVTLGGKLVVNKGGAISGTPKSIDLGSSGKVTIKGSNTCKKLKALISGAADNSTLESDKAAIEDMFNKYMNKALNGDIYGALKDIYPENVFAELEESFKEYGINLDEYLNSYLVSLMEQNGVDMNEIAAAADSVKVKVTKLTDCLSKLTDEQKSLLDGVGDITKAYTAVLNVEADGASYDLSQYISTEDSTITAAYAGGKWYVIG